LRLLYAPDIDLLTLKMEHGWQGLEGFKRIFQKLKPSLLYKSGFIIEQDMGDVFTTHLSYQRSSVFDFQLVDCQNNNSKIAKTDLGGSLRGWDVRMRRASLIYE
jgi:hypothetical protein